MSDIRLGFGTDIHRLIAGRRLILGGIEISSDVGADGHSDGDVLLHSVTDAILGALALGDIGTHFPNTDDRWKDAASIEFLRYATGLVSENGFRVSNVDSNINLEMPRLKPYIEQMRKNLSDILGVDPDRVSIKAKTGEKVDAVGDGRAVSANASVLLVAA